MCVHVCVCVCIRAGSVEKKSMETSTELASVEVIPVPSKPSRGVRKVKVEEGDMIKSDECNLDSDINEEQLSVGSLSEGEMDESQWSSGGAQVAPESLGGNQEKLGATLADELAADPNYLANTGDAHSFTHRTSTNKHTHTHTQANTHMYIHTHTQANTHVHAHAHAHAHAHTHTHTHTSKHTYIHIHTYTHKQTHTYIYTHAHTHSVHAFDAIEMVGSIELSLHTYVARQPPL